MPLAPSRGRPETVSPKGPPWLVSLPNDEGGRIRLPGRERQENPWKSAQEPPVGMALKNRWSLGNNYLGGITFGTWWRLLRENRFDVDAVYWHRAAFISLLSSSTASF